MKNTNSGNKYECCVMCGKAMNIPINQSIEYRENYVMGVGQLCEECRKKLESETQIF